MNAHAGEAAAHVVHPGDGEAVSLEPLGPRHTDAYDRLFRGDPRIADLAGLPELRDRRATAAWTRRGARANGEEPFAIKHGDRGMVGAIALVQHGAIGTFWFWIGAQHRDRGFGSRALALLRQAATGTFGLDGLFAFVRATNARSRRVIQAQGLRETGLTLLPRREGLLVYADGALATAPRTPDRIAALLSAIGSRLRLAGTRRRVREAAEHAITVGAP